MERSIDTTTALHMSASPNINSPDLGFAARCVSMESSTNSVTAQRFPILEKVPVELLLMVTDYLSPVDAACTALCSHQLFLGLRKAILRVSKDTQMRLDLLTRTSQHLKLKQYYLCFDCAQLHSCHKIALSSPFSGPPNCSNSSPRDRCPTSNTVYPCYTSFDFRSVHIQLAMKRFYHGPDFGIAVEDLCYTEISNWPLGENGRLQSTFTISSTVQLHGSFLASLKSVEARICPAPLGPSLYLRVQEMTMTRKEKVGHVFPFAMGKMAPLMICQHIEISRTVYGGGMAVESRADKANKRGVDFFIHQFFSGLDPRPMYFEKCAQCNTFWKLELRASNGKNVLLVFTRWLDLGPGLIPEDEPHGKIHQTDWPSESLEGHALVDARARFEN